MLKKTLVGKQFRAANTDREQQAGERSDHQSGPAEQNGKQRLGVFQTRRTINGGS